MARVSMRALSEVLPAKLGAPLPSMSGSASEVLLAKLAAPLPSMSARSDRLPTPFENPVGQASDQKSDDQYGHQLHRRAHRTNPSAADQSFHDGCLEAE